jgi:tRNA modification GTPase
MLDDTIAAIATPLGEAGLAVIRLSGPQALAVADRIFRPAGQSSSPPSAAPTHTLHYGHVVRQGRVVDEVLLSVMRAPRTFTREDVVELSCHGGILAAKSVLDTVLANGARLAQPGEFTQRAFLNGRLDLAQAEAVLDVIHARTELALSAAHEQLAGKLSQRIHLLRDDLMDALAHIEAHLDFPEEGISPETRRDLLARLDRGLGLVEALLRTAKEGRILRRGLRAAIVGRPNVGKSSLLNQILGHDRAIVSPLAGTTRDTIEEIANVRGIPVVFIDTAGLREPADALEEEGVRRSHASMAHADLILHVFDGAEPFTAEDGHCLARFARKPRILVRNKIDLPSKLALPDALGSPVVELCSLTGQGLDGLKDAIKDLVWGGAIKAEMLEVMINSRHQDALRRAQEGVERARDALRDDLGLEFVALELRIGTSAVGEIVGKTTTEDLLDSIFSQFCIGK